jgi:site-specific DNA-methyltransferase (adenine-specific)
VIACADVTALPLPDRSVDLVFGSPPYCDARSYGIGAQRDCKVWVEWMLDVTTECLRVSRGPVVWVAAGVTRDRGYWPACEGLMWEWYKRGGSMYRPCYWHRYGIPGSGGDQWFRADVEHVMCFKREGRLPWTANTACGHTPKWAPGGEMAHRLSNGTRVNQWGKPGSKTGTTFTGRPRPSHRSHTKRELNGEMREQSYLAPAVANPGTLIQTKTGGGHLGSRIAHENEAPFPEKLAEFFVLSLCPKNGTVLDPFSGSGTTAAVAQRHHRGFVACDVRTSQCDLTRRRMVNNQLSLIGAT